VLVLCIALPFILLGVIGHVCHVCPVGSEQQTWLEDSVRLTVTLQYSTFPSLYVTYADIEYGAGKHRHTWAPHRSIAVCMGSLCAVLLHSLVLQYDYLLVHAIKEMCWL
jgi:hypothetical protein